MVRLAFLGGRANQVCQGLVGIGHHRNLPADCRKMHDVSLGPEKSIGECNWHSFCKKKAGQMIS